MFISKKEHQKLQKDYHDLQIKYALLGEDAKRQFSKGVKSGQNLSKKDSEELGTLREKQWNETCLEDAIKARDIAEAKVSAMLELAKNLNKGIA